MKKLVIAEKPSVAQSIAKVIGADKRMDGFISGDKYIVSWCVGHLVELAMPEEYDGKYEIWKREDLPIIPDRFKYQVSHATKKQFDVLKKLMVADDIDTVINACDAGREGELIFRLVYEKAGCKKKIERLWISSMEDKAILDGFSNLKPGSDYERLYDAALCRERADWIIGMNGTRLFSTAYKRTLNVGRVMTPTLAMVIDRENERKKFVSEDFYTAEFDCGGIRLSSEKFKSAEEVEEIVKNLANEKNVLIIDSEKKEKEEKAPRLYDLTTLQREANKKYGFSAQQTLDYAQSLYEKKLITYPRTDSRFLTDDMVKTAENILSVVENKFSIYPTEKINISNVINSKKVTDHHAIIPTETVSNVVIHELPDGEKCILRLVAIRLAEAVSEGCKYYESKVDADYCGYRFSAKGKYVISHGWRAVNRVMEKINENEKIKEKIARAEYLGENIEIEKKEFDEDGFGGNIGFDVTSGQRLEVIKYEIKKGKTTPKKSYTEDTLLSAMERAGADETPDEAERKGLGTPATRAGVIEKLVRCGFIERRGDKKNKFLMPTEKGEMLIKVVPDEIKSAYMTAEWEEKLLLIEKDKYVSEDFMNEISMMITKLCNEYAAVSEMVSRNIEGKTVIGKCPACGMDVVEKSKGYFCESDSCKFALWKDNRFLDSLSKKMSDTVAEALLEKGRCRLKKCRSIKSGKIYDTTLVMNVSEEGSVSFGLDFSK